MQEQRIITNNYILSSSYIMTYLFYNEKYVTNLWLSHSYKITKDKSDLVSTYQKRHGNDRS